MAAGREKVTFLGLSQQYIGDESIQRGYRICAGIGLRQALRIEPAGVEAIGMPARHIRGQAVAQNDRLGLFPMAYRIENGAEEKGVRLGVSDALGGKDAVEIPVQPGR